MSPPRVCLVQPAIGTPSQTFLRAHEVRLPGVVGIVHKVDGKPAINGEVVSLGSPASRLLRIAHNLFRGFPLIDKDVSLGYEAALKRLRPNVVIAEFGTTGVEVLSACRRLHLPLIVYFRGYDATRSEVVDKSLAGYRRLFKFAFAIVAVSRSIARQLIELGCPPDKIIVNPSGVDAQQFCGARPEISPPHFISVGRMVEKKGHHLALLAFAQASRATPNMRLKIIGTGELLGICRDLALSLDLTHSVRFLGEQPHEVVANEMRTSRALVLHSIVASTGDSEGTPNVVLEAGAMGLPVVTTRHAGIPDVVISGVTGHLSEERDVAGMAGHLVQLARDPKLAGQMGNRASRHVREYFTVEQSLDRLHRVVLAAAGRNDLAPVRAAAMSEFPWDWSEDEFGVQSSRLPTTSERAA